ncbi:hypothetical protein B0O99DRAFT_585157 [Bisporella sp. PMI_857]|nr:hypothetical protein B0O99DRAFT_585157 [Bisporella sp. PMI_857]
MHFLAIFPALWVIIQVVLSSQTLVVPNTIRYGPSVTQFVSDDSGLDSPKVHPNNATNFDWWYFDAVSEDSSSSIVIVFYLATNLGFPFRLPLSAVSVDIFVSFDDGSLLFYPINSLPFTAGEATVVTDGNGSSGSWKSTGFEFTGTSDLSRYIVKIDSPILGIKGSLVLTSAAPAHYPCGPVEAGSRLEVSPHIGWANAMPDANAVADFRIGSRHLQFNGSGYHDKNWGDQPFANNVKSWYWGHGRLGPYSIVWFDVIAPNGTEYVSSYASLNGSIVAASCSGIKVRPTGKNSQFPPVVSSGNPQGFHIELNLGNEGIMEIDVNSTLVIADVVLYTRWIGTLSGGIRGGPLYEGFALYEQFKLAAF